MEKEPMTVPQLLSVHDLRTALAASKGLVVVQFTASWCGPCKMAKPQLDAFYASLDSRFVDIHVVDIDVSIQLFAFLKRHKIVRGIPTVLLYRRDVDEDYVPCDAVVSADPKELHAFFVRTHATLRNFLA